MRRRTALVAAAVTVVALVVAIPVGRWQAHRANAAEAHKVAVLIAAVGDPLTSPLFDAYRLAWSEDCLLYRHGADPYGIELCFDAQGRLVDAVDRRDGTSRLASFRPQPSASPLRIEPERLYLTLRAAGAFPASAPYPGALPLRFPPTSPAIRGFGNAISAIGGDLISSTLSLKRGRVVGGAGCLAYAPVEPSAPTRIEICFDRDGNIVRTGSFYTTPPSISTLARDPGQLRYRVDLAHLLRLFVGVHVLARDAEIVDGRLPPFSDPGTS